MSDVQIPLGACQNPACGYDGPEHVLTFDQTTVWECVKCGAKMKYASPSDVEVVNVQIADGAEMMQVNG